MLVAVDPEYWMAIDRADLGSLSLVHPLKDLPFPWHGS